MLKKSLSLSESFSESMSLSASNVSSYKATTPLLPDTLVPDYQGKVFKQAIRVGDLTHRVCSISNNDIKEKQRRQYEATILPKTIIPINMMAKENIMI